MADVPNPFELITGKLDQLLREVAELKEARDTGPKRIPFPQFCKQAGISRPTAYEWIRKKLVQSEMVGGRRYVIDDGTLIMPKRYNREAV